MNTHISIVGAGMVGLSTAWFLQERGAEVTVLERDHVAAGASWGNAGWLAPALTTPLPEPAVLRYGIRTALSSSSPLYVPLRPDVKLLRFLAGFARHSTERRWGVAMRAYSPINRIALEAFEALSEGGVDATSMEADPFLACFRTEEERSSMLTDLERIAGFGQEVKFDALSGEEVRRQEPALSHAVGAAVRLHGQRYINPPAFAEALAASVRERGGRIREGVGVKGIRPDQAGVMIETTQGAEHYDAVVIANGAQLRTLAAPFGVRQLVQAGRGYSFSVECETVPGGPVYFPEQRIACTPLSTPAGNRLRVTGMMEFRRDEAPLDQRRVSTIVETARPMFQGVDLDRRQDEWVGSRPCTVDGLPLVGVSRSPNVFIAGGHGMWGIVLGPATGQLLAERILTGLNPPTLTPFDPLR